MVSSETPRSIPWYKRFRDEFSKASRYIYAVERIPIKRETLENFDKETLARFIFESNNIEREGLSLGETRELVIFGLEEYSELIEKNDDKDATAQERRIAIFNLMQKIIKDIPIDFGIAGIFNQNITDENEEIQLDDSQYELIAKYGNKNKEADKVIRYFGATRIAEHYSSNYMFLRLKQQTYYIIQAILKVRNHKKREIAQKFFDEHFTDGPPPSIESLITEERIKSLHQIMAEGFVDEKNAKAGQYRTKPIMTDMESHYPAPEDVPAAMANFVKKYQEFESQGLNPIALAAWASTQFVLIHPFPDFNGRMSRLLMNMILKAHNVPFWVSLSSSGKERKKYIAALRQAREGNYLWIATLIAIQLNKEFHELNKMLDLSGYDQIEIDASNEFPPEQSDKEILFTFLKNE